MDEAPIRNFVLTHHYSVTFPVARLQYGLLDLRPNGSADSQLVGAVVFGNPMNPASLTGPFPQLEPYYESLEMSRMVLLEEVPANAESWFCAQAFDHAADKKGLRGVVAFSDPMERRRTGPDGTTIIKPGHVGTVYQALSAAYLGRSKARTLIVLPDGTTLTDRTAAKIPGRERGAAGVVARLVTLGATPPAADESPVEWLSAALASVGAQRVPHPGNHRYAFRIGTRAQRSRTTIPLTAHPYPKLHTAERTEP